MIGFLVRLRLMDYKKCGVFLFNKGRKVIGFSQTKQKV